MRKSPLIYEEMRKYLVIYEESLSHIRLCNRSRLNFLIYEEIKFSFFISVALSERRFPASCTKKCYLFWEKFCQFSNNIMPRHPIGPFIFKWKNVERYRNIIVPLLVKLCQTSATQFLLQPHFFFGNIWAFWQNFLLPGNSELKLETEMIYYVSRI
jgi:hypothetical protein